MVSRPACRGPARDGAAAAPERRAAGGVPPGLRGAAGRPGPSRGPERVRGGRAAEGVHFGDVIASDRPEQLEVVEVRVQSYSGFWSDPFTSSLNGSEVQEVLLVKKSLGSVILSDATSRL